VRSPTSHLTAGLSAAVLALALSACGSNSGAGSGTAATPTATAGSSSSAPATASSPAAGGTAATATEKNAVTATESDFAIALSSAELTAGTYSITVTNSGKATHSLTIKGPGGVDMTSDTLQGGKTTTMTVTLRPGQYEVYCPIGNHRAMGMDTTLTVR
jgi:plastocyanin